MTRILTACLAFTVLCAAAPPPPVPVILDTDIGDDIDDALALSLALQSPELKVLAVTTVLRHGQERADLAARILELFHRTDVPVGIGAEETLMGGPQPYAKVIQHGALPSGFRFSAPRRNGLELMIETCLRAPGKVTILAYGPLTNIALALRAESRIKDKIERIVLMNGVFFRPGLEYNTLTDAEASAIVYASGLPIETVGLDVTMQCRLNAAQMGRIEESKLDTAQFLLQLIRMWQNANHAQFPILHDPLSVAVAIRPDLVSTVTGGVSVETRGTPGETQGMTVFRENPKGNVRVANEVNSAAVIDFFLDRVLAPPRQ